MQDTVDASGGFESWLDARGPSLHRLARLLCAGDDHAAADLAQTALVKLYLARPRLRDRDRVDGYARRILVNEHRRTWARAERRHEVVTGALPEAAVLDAPDHGTSAEVWSLVASLPPRQRAVVVLRYYEELTEAETADVLGIAVGTVKSQASRALAALRTRLPEELR